MWKIIFIWFSLININFRELMLIFCLNFRVGLGFLFNSHWAVQFFCIFLIWWPYYHRFFGDGRSLVIISISSSRNTSIRLRKSVLLYRIFAINIWSQVSKARMIAIMVTSLWRSFRSIFFFFIIILLNLIKILEK